MTCPACRGGRSTSTSRMRGSRRRRSACRSRRPCRSCRSARCGGASRSSKAASRSARARSARSGRSAKARKAVRSTRARSCSSPTASAIQARSGSRWCTTMARTSQMDYALAGDARLTVRIADDFVKAQKREVQRARGEFDGGYADRSGSGALSVGRVVPRRRRRGAGDADSVGVFTGAAEAQAASAACRGTTRRDRREPTDSQPDRVCVRLRVHERGRRRSRDAHVERAGRRRLVERHHWLPTGADRSRRRPRLHGRGRGPVERQRPARRCSRSAASPSRRRTPSAATP